MSRGRALTRSLLLLGMLGMAAPLPRPPQDSPSAEAPPRVVVSTDIGGTDPDDFQSFVRVWDGRKTVFARLTSAADTAEAFGVVEFALPVPSEMRAGQAARMIVDGRIPAAAVREDDVLRFRFSPRDAKVWPYVIRSEFAGLDGLSGQFTAAPPPADRTSRPAHAHPHWWTDDPEAAAAEGVHAGAKHVSRWREAFLRDFAARLDRTARPASR